MRAADMSFEEWSDTARMITVGGYEVATYALGASASGSRGTVTYLHGFPSSAHDIGAVADRLLSDATVLALDFPGFGASEKPVGHPWSIAACADAVEAMWIDRGVSSTVLVSHDYGATVGQELLARRAERNTSATIAATVWHNGGIYPDLHRPTLGQQMLLDPEHGREVAEAMTEELFHGGIEVTWGTRRPITPEVTHAMWSSMQARGGAGRAHELLHYVAERRQHSARWVGALESCDVPMWFVWGDLDPVSGAHMIARVETNIASARINRLADVGHWPPLEAPDECAEAIRAAIAG